jgi:hypothetical protein
MAAHWNCHYEGEPTLTRVCVRETQPALGRACAANQPCQHEILGALQWKLDNSRLAVAPLV